AVKVRTTTRNIKANTGKVKEFTKRDGTIGQFNVKRVVAQEFGAKVEITRKELNKQLAKRGKNEIEKDGYFYPAAVEMGTFYSVAQKPMKRVIPDAKKA